MAHRFGVFGGVLAYVVLSAATATAFTAPAGDFSVAFVAAPTVEVQAPRSPADPGRRSYRLAEAGRLFEVTVDEYPAVIPPPPPDPESYRLLLNAHARQTGWRLAQTERVQVSGASALQGRFESDDGRVELVRVLMVGRDIYQVRAVARDASDVSSAVAFLASFTVKTTLSSR